ncbi:hypothetical protein F5Y19DRAFT_315617 [Xylariaceae sp. FL1651]|nr:hypothetical protein F5Y19DRAFT_315617 [Xylariaceae sp. FL1651]
MTTVGALIAYSAAIHGLKELTRIREGEKILILHGTGMSGVAAVVIIQLAGAVPSVAANTQEEANFLQGHFGLTKENIIQPGSDSECDNLTMVPDGYGADVVFSAGSVHPNEARKAWRSIARFGLFSDSGRQDVLS